MLFRFWYCFFVFVLLVFRWNLLRTLPSVTEGWPLVVLWQPPEPEEEGHKSLGLSLETTPRVSSATLTAILTLNFFQRFHSFFLVPLKPKIPLEKSGRISCKDVAGRKNLFLFVFKQPQNGCTWSRYVSQTAVVISSGATSVLKHTMFPFWQSETNWSNNLLFLFVSKTTVSLLVHLSARPSVCPLGLELVNSEIFLMWKSAGSSVRSTVQYSPVGFSVACLSVCLSV